MLNKVIGSSNGVDSFDRKCRNQFPLPETEFYADIAQTPQGQTVAVIIDPFMRRVHQTIPQCG